MRRTKPNNLRRVGVLTVSSAPEHTRAIATTVIEVTRGEMKLGLANPLLPGLHVELRLDSGEMIAGNIRYCRQVDEEEYHIGVRRAGVDEVLERRKEPRYPTTGRAAIRFLRQTGPVEMHATVGDASRSGLGLFVREPIMPGTAIELTFDGSTVTGIVRNCRPRFSGFRIGIALTNVEPRPRRSSLVIPFRETIDRSRAWVSRALRQWTPRPN